MSNHDISFHGGSSFPFQSGNAIIDSALCTMTRLFYTGRWIEANEKLAEIAANAKLDEHKAILEALKSIANNTQDDNLKLQMFDRIYMLAVSWA